MLFFNEKTSLTRNFSGKSFRSKTLVKEDFNRAKLQGTNFSRANLDNADFTDSEAGTLNYQRVFSVMGSVFLAGFSGLLWGASSFLILLTFEAELYGKIPSSILLLSTILTLIFTFQKSLMYGLIVGLCVLVPNIILSVFSINSSSGVDLGAYFFIGAGSIILMALGLIVSVLARLILVSIGCSIITAYLIISCVEVLVALYAIETDIFFVIGVFMIFGNCMSQKSLTGMKHFYWLRKGAVNFAAIGGTSFRKANLTEANFSNAKLEHTDFRAANLTRTRWYQAEGLESARLDKTYLANLKIRQLVVSCKGQRENFDGLDLTGVNLQRANLQNASFIGANLNQSDLQYANLSGAILKQTQLDNANLTGANLTGACIEDWGMTSTTHLESVQCDYVYMRLQTLEKRNPLRKPDDERKNFNKGEFADFIQPYFDTLDLYHSQGVDPRSISLALKNLAGNHPDAELQFVAIEWRGNGLNIRYTTAPDVDKSELNREYFTDYARIRKEQLGSIQLRLAAQDAEINRMEGVINKFIQTGTHQSTIRAENIQVIHGEVAMTENKGISINTGDNASISGLSSGDGIVNLGTISGNVTNAINRIPDSPEPAQANLKTLLAQLKQVIENDSALPDPDKADLLEHVQSLAEAKQVEESAKREGIVRKAMKMFDATLRSLPDTAKIVDACSKLLPRILEALG